MSKNLYKVKVLIKKDKNGKPMLKDDVWFVPANSEQQAEQEMMNTNGVDRVLSVEYSATLSEFW